MPPAPPAETEEEAEARKQQHEQQRKEHEAEQERRAEEFRQKQEREEKEYEEEQARRDEQRKARQATFDRILENAPASFTAAQLRVILRAIVNLDPYTFADDLAEDIAAENENEQRSAEEVLLATIDTTADEKLTAFALRLALSGHVGIPRENQSRLPHRSRSRLPLTGIKERPTRQRQEADAGKAAEERTRQEEQTSRRSRSQPNQAGGRKAPATSIPKEEPGAAMDKTEQAIRRTLAAIDAPLYDIGILNERGMYPRMDGLTAAQVQRSIPYLRFRNTHRVRTSSFDRAENTVSPSLTTLTAPSSPVLLPMASRLAPLSKPAPATSRHG